MTVYKRTARHIYTCSRIRAPIKCRSPNKTCIIFIYLYRYTTRIVSEAQEFSMLTGNLTISIRLACIGTALPLRRVYTHMHRVWYCVYRSFDRNFLLFQPYMSKSCGRGETWRIHAHCTLPSVDDDDDNGDGWICFGGKDGCVAVATAECCCSRRRCCCMAECCFRLQAKTFGYFPPEFLIDGLFWRVNHSHSRSLYTRYIVINCYISLCTYLHKTGGWQFFLSHIGRRWISDYGIPPRV